jgi:hypothetical protein
MRLSSPRSQMLSWGDSPGHGETRAHEIERLAVRDGPARERSPCRPLVAEHRPKVLLLDGVVAPDDRVDTLGRDHRNLVAGHELHDSAVVIGMRVRDEDSHERLSKRLDLRAERTPVRERESAVDSDDSVGCLDQVGVDEGAGRAGGVLVDANVLHGEPPCFASSFQAYYWRRTTGSGNLFPCREISSTG